MAGQRAMAGALLAMAVACLCSATVYAEVDCSAQLNALQPCIEYVNGNGTAPPTKPCCTAFHDTQVTMPVCLCQLQQAFSDPATAPGNVTRANQIPSLCSVVVDPSRCPALLGGAPATAPGIAPVAAPKPAPVAAPKLAPVEAPKLAPVEAPKLAPVEAPKLAPVAAPKLAPVAASPPSAEVDCTAEFDSLSSCISYVSSNATTPPAACCSALLSVHTNRPVCLCQLLQEVNADPSAVSGLNVTKALELPAVCKVNGADVNNCPALLGQPVASPVDSPFAAPVPETGPVPEAGAPGVDVDTPAPDATPAVSEPTGSGASISTASVLVGFAALTMHLVF